MKLTSHEVNFIFYKGVVILVTKVRQLRTCAKMTQTQLAEQVHVSVRTIISIEKEQYSPSLMLAYRIARIFGVSVEELCCLQLNMEMEDRNEQV